MDIAKFVKEKGGQFTENEVACGKCGSCCERLTAFADNGIEDPAEYSDRETYKTFTVEGN